MDRITSLIATLRNVCTNLPDKRVGDNVQYTMADIGMSAFSVFFMQSPSFLNHQRNLLEGQSRSNCQTLFEMKKIPCDNHIRKMLDPVDPSLFYPVFDEALNTLEADGGLGSLRCLKDHVLIALDGTEYHRSAKVHCQNCSTVTKAKGKKTEKTEYFHAMVQAAMVAPGHNRAVPLPPAFIVPQDGTEKQDCESRACRRWLLDHAPTYARLNPIYLGDDLYSCQSICQAVIDAKAHFIFVCKPDSHQTLTEYLFGVEIDQRIEKVKRGKKIFRYTYRWMSDLPLRDGIDALCANWFSIEICDPDGKITYRNSFVTNLPVNRDNVIELVACGRARWKVENETFNTLKTKGYNLEHNFGHGNMNLAAVLVTLNLLAFAIHTVADLVDDLWKLARQKAYTRTGFFNRLRAITSFLVFDSWRKLLKALAFQVPLPEPP